MKQNQFRFVVSANFYLAENTFPNTKSFSFAFSVSCFSFRILINFRLGNVSAYMRPGAHGRGIYEVERNCRLLFSSPRHPYTYIYFYGYIFQLQCRLTSYITRQPRTKINCFSFDGKSIRFSRNRKQLACVKYSAASLILSPQGIYVVLSEEKQIVLWRVSNETRAERQNNKKGEVLHREADFLFS